MPRISAISLILGRIRARGASPSTPGPFNSDLIMIASYSDSVICAQFDAHGALRRPFFTECHYFTARYKSEISNLQNELEPHSVTFTAAGSKDPLDFTFR